MRRRSYDLVVLGGGSAGLIAAQTAAGLGARVALVEPAEQPGGDCLFTGCVPSKSLIASARLAHEIRNADRLGLEPAEPRFTFTAVMERVQQVIERAGEPDTPAALARAGVEVVRGFGRFVAPGTVAVDGRRLSYRTAIVATGSRPAVPELPGIERAEPLTNESVFDLRELPPRLAVLGGGPVGVELAQAFARLGSQVELVEAEPVLLPREEAAASELVATTLAAEGVRVRRGHSALRLEPAEGGSGTLVAAGPDGEVRIPYDRLLVAVGRRPSTEGLGLDSVGVQLTGAGAVRADRRLRTNGRNVYAAGDVLGGLQLTHVAAYHGLVAAANALLRTRQSVDHSAVPWVTFSDPEVARVGLTEAEARADGRPLVFDYDYARSDRALTAAEARGFAKLVADRRGRLLGATLVGPAAGESIAEVARLVGERRTVAELSRQIHAYPTYTEAPARAADDWWRRRYLNPTGRRILRPVLALLRVLDRPRG